MAFLDYIAPAELPPAQRREATDRVVVCGAGPVGLTAALNLAMSGVSVTVLEKLPTLSTQSRASTFHPPTLELLETLGVADEILARGLKAPTTQFRDRTKGPIATFDLSVISDETTYPFRVQLEQSKLTPLLLKKLTDGAASGEYDVQVLFEHRVHSCALEGDRAVLSIGTESELFELDAPWVIAADGAHSPVRETLGIALDGDVYPERFLVVSVANELRDHLDDLAFVNYVADPEEWLVLLRTPDHWRVLFPIQETDDDVVLDPAAIQARLDRVVDIGGEWDVLATSLYVVAKRAAETMRLGAVLLAGDAGHQNSPLGGMGMNSGIQDAMSASRRLARVLGGEPESLLDEYSALRHQVATEHVHADSHANWLVLREPDPAVREQLQEEMRAVAADPEAHRERMKRSAMIDSVRENL